MKLKSLTALLLLLFLILPAGLAAEDQKEPFTLNGKPVPEVVAKVNGVPLHSQALERDLFAFRFRSKQWDRK